MDVCVYCSYGTKVAAAQLLQEWVEQIGSEAGLTAENTRINSGSIGSPESRLELEVEFGNLAELENFWASIPADLHKTWSEKVVDVIIHGSPTWEIFRSIDPFPSGLQNEKTSARSVNAGKSTGTEGLVSATGSSNVTAVGLQVATEEDMKTFGKAMASDTKKDIESIGATNSSGLAVVSGEKDAKIVLDWKGEPMKINPGDKLPFDF